MKICILFSIFIVPFLLFAEEDSSKINKNKLTAIPIPDVDGVPSYKSVKEEEKKDKNQIKNSKTSEDIGLEEYYISNVRALPISEGFANRPKNLENEKLLIVGRIQFRGLSGQKESSFNNGKTDYNSVDWNFRRVRFGFIYEGNKWWGMLAQIAVEKAVIAPYITTKRNPVTGSLEEVELNKAEGQLYQANMWFHLPFMDSMLFLGQIRLPFLREWSSAATMLTPERSYTHSTLPQFDLGAQYVFYPLSLLSSKYKKYVLARFSASNGSGGSGQGVGYKTGLTETKSGSNPLLVSPAYNWRLTYDPFGGFIRDGYDIGWHEGEEIFQSNQRLSIGIGGTYIRELQVISSYDPYVRGVSNQKFLALQKTPTGGEITPSGTNYLVDNTETTPSRRRMDLKGSTLDFTYTINGYYASGAYTRFTGQASNNTESYYGTIGYAIPYKDMHWMPTYRYEVIEGDFNRNNRRDNTDLLRSHWIGLNFFAERHLMKFQLFYRIEEDRLGFNPITRESRDVNNNKFYFQVQMVFWSGALKMED
ncbi:MAG: hypothetical protein GW761_12065 [Leptospira sp.]|nr:hypothetical protein [Leptospira sp.]